MPGSDSRQRLPRPDRTSKAKAADKGGARREHADSEAAAPDERAAPLASGTRSDSFQQHAAVLGDSRLAHSVNASPRQTIARTLQRQYGNGYVQRLADHVGAVQPGTFQPKLTIGPAGDKFEQEADQVAKQVLQELSVQRQSIEEEEPLQAKRLQRESIDEEELQAKRMQRMYRPPTKPEEETSSSTTAKEEKKPGAAVTAKRVQRQALEEEEPLQAKRVQSAGDPASMEGGDVGSDFEANVAAAAGKGAPLTEGVRSEMEAAFGHDFGKVRVHTDAQANALNHQVQALAFTTGPDIFFRDGQYSPGSSEGNEVLAHELTHVVQQGGATPKLAKAARKRKPSDEA